MPIGAAIDARDGGNVNDSDKVVMEGVREYAEDFIPTIYLKDEGDGADRWVVEAENEGGYNATCVDVLDLLTWIKVNRPDLWALA